MARVLLDNEAWDFGSNCFVCEPKNERGLGIPFYLDEESERVVADFTPETQHSGAPAFAHGGFSMALLDEGMAWAVIAIAHRFGVTRKSESTFVRPVRIGQAHTLACWIASGEGETRSVAGEILDNRGKVCVQMQAEFFVMTKEQADAAIGVASVQAASFTR